MNNVLLMKLYKINKIIILTKRKKDYLMDDFNIGSLHESKNEWGCRLLSILSPHIMDGMKSIFDESYKLCKENKEEEKYLMTFQNFITRIPKWNATIIDIETKRVIEKSACIYLEELITCVHIIHLKLLSAIRVGQKQRQINIDIPKLSDFLHKIYIHFGRRVYKNVYLFQINLPALEVQRHQRELEILCKESIMQTIRDSIPVEALLNAYMDETTEDVIVEETREVEVPNPSSSTTSSSSSSSSSSLEKNTYTLPAMVKDESSSSSSSSHDALVIPNLKTEAEILGIEEIVSSSPEDKKQSIRFNDIDEMKDEENKITKFEKSKDINTLEKLADFRKEKEKNVIEAVDLDDDYDRIKINFDDPPLSNSGFGIGDLVELSDITIL